MGDIHQSSLGTSGQDDPAQRCDVPIFRAKISQQDDQRSPRRSTLRRAHLRTSLKNTATRLPNVHGAGRNTHTSNAAPSGAVKAWDVKAGNNVGGATG